MDRLALIRIRSVFWLVAAILLLNPSADAAANRCVPFTKRILGVGVSKKTTALNKDMCIEELEDYSLRPSAVDMAAKQYVRLMGQARMECKGTFETDTKLTSAFNERIPVWVSYTSENSPSPRDNCAIRATFPARATTVVCTCSPGDIVSGPNMKPVSGPVHEGWGWQTENEINETAEMMDKPGGEEPSGPEVLPGIPDHNAGQPEQAAAPSTNKKSTNKVLQVDTLHPNPE
jgi:hypothetical protein